MKTIPLRQFSTEGKKTSLCLGFFDGVHRGHQRILLETVNNAKMKEQQSAVFTFPSHPLSIIYPQNTPLELTTFGERRYLMELQELDYFIWTDFTTEFSQHTPESFVGDILVERLNAKDLFIGPNYHFGIRASGNPDTLKDLGRRFGFEVHIIPPMFFGNEMISSTLIRQSIRQGEVFKASRMLGRYYNIKGMTESYGNRRKDCEQAFMKLRIPEQRVLPAPGVYSGYVKIEKKSHIGVIYISEHQKGANLYITFIPSDAQERLPEREASFYFVQKLREEETSDFGECESFIFADRAIADATVLQEESIQRSD